MIDLIQLKLSNPCIQQHLLWLQPVIIPTTYPFQYCLQVHYQLVEPLYINELKCNILECLITPSILLGGPVIYPLAEEEVPVEAGGEGALLVGLAGLEGLLELLLLQVVAPGVDVLVLQVRDQQTHAFFASHKQLCMSKITTNVRERLFLIS